MDGHVEKLKLLCRICGLKYKLNDHYRKPKLATEYRDIILSSCGFDPSEDKLEIHPENLCVKHHLQFYRLRIKMKNSKEEIVFPKVDAVTFDPHDELNCKICDGSKRSGRPATKQIQQIKNADNFMKSVIKISSDFDFKLFSNESGVIQLYQMQKDNPVVSKSVKIHNNGKWTINVLSKDVPNSNLILDAFPSTLLTTDDLKLFFGQLNETTVCPGNNNFQSLISRNLESAENFKGIDGTDVGIIETESGETLQSFVTIRHKSCQLLIPSTLQKCDNCKEHQEILRVKDHRRKSAEGKTPHIKTNDRYLTSSELMEKLKNLEKEKKNLSAKVVRWQQKVKQFVKRDGVTLNKEMDDMVTDVIKKNQSPFDSQTPQHLLWEQQKLQSNLPNKKGMRWHPLIIRWCLSIYLKSPSTYKLIKESPFLNLPCKNTLLKYVNFTDPGCGFNKDIISELIKAVNFNAIADYQHNVSLVFDEMKVKSGLVFCKTTGKLVGFSELGDVNELTAQFEQQIDSEENDYSKPLAKYAIVFMVRGIFSSLCFPFGHFASEGFTSDQIYHCAWEAVKILESINLNVRSIVADGASPNRKFFRLHRLQLDENARNGNVFWTWNEWCPSRKIYFFCDVPHLIKTTRNNLENSHGNKKTRNLMLDGQGMGWHQILNLYDWDLSAERDVIGLKMGHKLRDEHVNLNPNTRMRVNLAAQVLSSTVVNMLAEQGNQSTSSLQKFILMIDKFFDCLNVSKKVNTTRKPDLNVYQSSDDPRFSWLEDVFLKFIDDWENDCYNIEGLKKEEQNRLCLSKQTLEGLRITVYSFTTLGRALLNEHRGKYLLSEKFSQDPLEEYFSKQRQRGGANENPSLQEVNRNFVGLTVAGNDLVKVLTGNYRGRFREEAKIDITNMNLPPVKRLKR